MPVAAVLAAMALALQPMLGHAGALGGSLGTTLIISEVLHLLAAGAWLGSLLPLFITLGTLPHNAAATACRSFTPVGLSAVLVLGGTATVQVTEFMGGVPGLFGTGYGHIALVKLGLFAVLLALAAINRLALTERLAGAAPDAARRHMRVSVATEAVLGTLVVLTAGFLASHAPGTHEQPVWPFAWRPSLSAFYAPELRNEVTLALLAVGAAVIIAVIGVVWRKVRWPALVVAAITLALAIPHLDLLFVEAYPTSFYTSPTEFAATAIVHGAKLFAANCVVCHGAEGRGDGPSAKSLPWPPADLTAEHFWAHSDGELFWYLSHGFDCAGRKPRDARLRNRTVKRGALGSDRLSARAQRRREHADDRQMGASAADTAIRYSLCERTHPRPRRFAGARVAHRRDVRRRSAAARGAGGDRHHDGHTRQETACWMEAGGLRRERTRDLDCIRDPVGRIERGLGRRADTDRSERMAAGGMAAR